MCVRSYLLHLCVINVQFLQLCVRSKLTCQNTNNRDCKIYSAFIGTSFVRLNTTMFKQGTPYLQELNIIT